MGSQQSSGAGTLDAAARIPALVAAVSGGLAASRPRSAPLVSATPPPSVAAAAVAAAARPVRHGMRTRRSSGGVRSLARYEEQGGAAAQVSSNSIR